MREPFSAFMKKELDPKTVLIACGLPASYKTETTEVIAEIKGYKILRSDLIRLEVLKKIAQEAMTEMRLLIYQLHPPVIQESGLAVALRRRLDAVEVRSGVAADFQVEGERRLPSNIEYTLFQIAQEGLNNVLKHAKASGVLVRLSFTPDVCRLTIRDDGIGFGPESIERYGGYGLANMRDQLEQINGTLSIDSLPGKGTTLDVEVSI